MGIARGRGWCQAHYMRWYTTGDAGTELIVRRERGRICSVEGCSRKHQGRGFCDRHLGRFIATGDAGPAEIEARRPDAICSVADCEKIIRRGGRGWCSAHYQRWRKTGDPASPLTFGRLEDVGYGAMHSRLRKHDRASNHPCVDCGQPAQHWAYDHADPNEKRDERLGVPFSTDPAHYRPMCQPCHRRFDVSHMPVVVCSVDGCGRPQKARALCEKHYRKPL